MKAKSLFFIIQVGKRAFLLAEDMSGRRRGSKWDLKEDVSPENHHDVARSTKAGSSFHECESREYMSGRRGFQRDERMNEESMLGWEGDGHYARRMSPGPDGWKQQNRSCSPRRSRGRSYRSRSKSRSRSPAQNPRREPELNHRNNSKLGHSAPLCRDFAAGRCRKGDLCRFAHHGSPNHDGRRHFASRTDDGWESRRRDDGAMRRHSDTYSSVGRSAHICNDFLKGRCTRGASCRYRHHDSGSDEFGKGTIDGNFRDGDNDWRNKSGSSYDREPPVSSERICKFFASGNCRNGKQCRFSHQSDKYVYPERSAPDGSHLEHNLDGTNKVWNDPNWGDMASHRSVPDAHRSVPEAHGWEVDRSDYMEPGKSRAGESSKDDLVNHELDGSTYMKGASTGGNEKMSSVETQSHQWKINDISNPETKGTEKGFNERKLLHPTGIFISQMGHVGEKSDSLPFSHISQSTGEQDIAQRALAENRYVSGIMQPNMSGECLQPNPSFQVDNATGARINGSSYANVNVPADIPHGQGFHQIDGGFRAPPISSMENVGQRHPSFLSHQQRGENITMPYHQSIVDTNLATGQSQSTFAAHSKSEGLPMPNHQAVADSNPIDGAYASNVGVTDAASGTTLSQNSNLNEKLAQYSHLSATLAQLLEKSQQLPQIYAAAIAQQSQSATDGAPNLSDSAVSIPPSAAASEPNQASEPTRQYNPSSDGLNTKITSTSKELLPSLPENRSSVLGLSEIPSSTSNPTSFATGLMTIGDPKSASCGDESRHQSHDLNMQGPVVANKEEDGQTTGKGVDETQETLDQGPTEDMALDNGTDDGKKAKDAKGIRSFKFALAEFIKELLKPTWKEGKMSKEVYKTIVKKVVDKVTDTIQVAHIPRTKEKIDQYLSFSKPKLNKLVQAYLEKYQKA